MYGSGTNISLQTSQHRARLARTRRAHRAGLRRILDGGVADHLSSLHHLNMAHCDVRPTVHLPYPKMPMPATFYLCEYCERVFENLPLCERHERLSHGIMPAPPTPLLVEGATASGLPTDESENSEFMAVRTSLSI